jgi:hypothetical protein
MCIFINIYRKTHNIYIFQQHLQTILRRISRSFVFISIYRYTFISWGPPFFALQNSITPSFSMSQSLRKTWVNANKYIIFVKHL